jgi:adenylate kinase family enzyme
LRKVVIFGNSSSGKTSLARKICGVDNLCHLDLDSIAWRHGSSPVRKPIEEARREIEEFIKANECWVIEGCYSDLLEIVIPEAGEMIFMKLPVEACIANAKNRPWEPHKYKSKKAQDANLSMLIHWISQYTDRRDCFSKASHEALFASYQGKKTIHTSNESSGA